MATMAGLRPGASSAVWSLGRAQQDEALCSRAANASFNCNVRLLAQGFCTRANVNAASSQKRGLTVRCAGEGAKVGFLGRLGRVIKEKAKSDIELLFSGFSKTRENLAVVDELLTYWNLSESESVLDDLEEVLFPSL